MVKGVKASKQGEVPGEPWATRSTRVWTRRGRDEGVPVDGWTVSKAKQGTGLDFWMNGLFLTRDEKWVVGQISF